MLRLISCDIHTALCRFGRCYEVPPVLVRLLFNHPSPNLLVPQEVADSMLPVYLSSLTAGVTLASEGVDKALIAFERSGMRGTGGRRGLVL